MAEILHKIGCFGGTFDPIHNGHLIIAQHLLEYVPFERIIFIPSGRPPHKQGELVTSAEHRYEMVYLAVEGNEFFSLEDFELKEEGLSYTIDTVKYLHSIYGEHTQLTVIIGADIVFDLPSWKSMEDLFKMVGFLAVARPGYDEHSLRGQISMLKEKYGASISFITAPLIDISSTGVRQKVMEGKSIRYLVPHRVEEYIIEKGLYK